MQIYFLGTNGWHDSETGETPCVLIDSKEAYVVLDAGNAFRKIDRHIKDKKKPIYVFLSHFHIDHISGLHILLKFNFPQGIVLAGQPGAKDILGRFLSKPFTAPLEQVNKKFPINIIELNPGKNKLGNIELEADYLVHADPCFGYSFFLEGKKITYCTDTGVCDSMLALAKNSDLLIAECAWKQRHKSDWPHLAPEDGAEAAKKANAKNLVLMHFDALNYQSREERKDAELRAKKIFKNTIGAFDDFQLTL